MAADLVKEEPQRVAGIFDTIIDAVTGGGDVCIPIVGCVDVGAAGEEAILRELRSQITADNAPLLVQTDSAYPTTSQLPGGQMSKVQVLDFSQLSANTLVPAGDYAIPVTGYCLEERFSSPNGHRYQLAPLGGTRQSYVTDFLSAAQLEGLTVSETQGVVWALRSGMTLNDMPEDMQSLVTATIPQHRKALNKETVTQQIRGTSSEVLSLFGYRSLDQFLLQEFGDIGQLLVQAMQLEDQLLGNDDWRSLSSGFLNETAQGVGNIEQTPWSEVSPGFHARFVTEKNMGDIGALIVRISPEFASQQSTSVAAKQVSSGMTVQDLANATAEMVAVPEGTGSVQPLALQIAQLECLSSSAKAETVDNKVLPAAAAVVCTPEAIVGLLAALGLGVYTAQEVQDILAENPGVLQTNETGQPSMPNDDGQTNGDIGTADPGCDPNNIDECLPDNDTNNDSANDWDRGTYSDARSSLESHFRRHGSRVGASSVEEYALQARTMYRQVQAQGTQRAATGRTPDGRVIFRYRTGSANGGRFLDVTSDGRIISYGARVRR